MKRLLTRCGLVMVLVGLSTSAQVTAQETPAQEAQTVDPKVTSQVEELLAGYEYVPKAEDWARIGPQAAIVLRQIAADPKAQSSKRARAVSSLAHFPQDDNQTFLTELLQKDTNPALLRRKAIRALAVAFGPQSLPTIKPYLADADHRLRESAILAIGAVRTDEARTLLKERLSLEPSDHLKETLEETLEKMN